MCQQMLLAMRREQALEFGKKCVRHAIGPRGTPGLQNMVSLILRQICRAGIQPCVAAGDDATGKWFRTKPQAIYRGSHQAMHARARGVCYFGENVRLSSRNTSDSEEQATYPGISEPAECWKQQEHRAVGEQGCPDSMRPACHGISSWELCRQQGRVNQTSGSYARLGASQRSASEVVMPFRRA